MRLPNLGTVSSLIAVLLVGAALAWLAVLRPASLGGSTAYVFVGGSSMLPTYKPGDLLVAQPATSYQAGDVIVYRIPQGSPGEGRLVVHRIVAGDGAAGFTTQGDNNAYTDPWTPRHNDIVGRPLAVVPGAGIVIGLLRQPLVAASLATLIVLSALWPLAGGGRSGTNPPLRASRT